MNEPPREKGMNDEAQRVAAKVNEEAEKAVAKVKEEAAKAVANVKEEAANAAAKVKEAKEKAPPRKFHVTLKTEDSPSESRPLGDRIQKALGAALKALGLFVLTTVMASFVTAWWQTRHWAEQTAYDARNSRAKTRIDLTTSVVQRISEAFSASNQVVYLTILRPSGIFTERMRNARLRTSTEEWFVSNQKWRVEQGVLLAETKAHFADPQIHAQLAAIVANRDTLFRLVTEFIEASGGQTIPPDGEPRKQLLERNAKIYNVVLNTIGPAGLLPKLSELMIREARADQQAPAWDSLWNWITARPEPPSQP